MYGDFEYRITIWTERERGRTENEGGKRERVSDCVYV